MPISDQRRLDHAAALVHVAVDDDVQALAKQRHAPALHRLLEQVGSALRIVDMQLEQMAVLAALDGGRRTFSHQFAGHHQPETVALLGLLQVVSGDQNRRPGVGEAVDQPPERAPRDRVDAGGRLVQKQHARLVHDGRAERHALFPAAGQAADQLMLLALETGKLEHPANLLLPLVLGHTVDAGKEVQVLIDGQIVVQRKLLRHVADSLAHVRRTQMAPLARELHLSARRIEQPAEHLDRRGLARAVGAEQAVDFAVAHLQRDVVHGAERPECLREIRRADRHLSAQVVMIVAARKWRMRDLQPERMKPRDERVLQQRLVPSDFVDLHASVAQAVANLGFRQGGLVHQHVEAVAEPLHVEDVRIGVVHRGQHLLGPSEWRRTHFQSSGAEAAANLIRRADLLDRAGMHQRHAVAAFRLVEIRRGHQNRQAVGRQMRERIPEFTPRDRIDAGRRLVEQQHLRLRNQRARERELLLHAAAQPAGQSIGEPIHVEHLQVAMPATIDLGARHATKVADVLNVLADGEIRIEAECLRQIAGLCTGLPGLAAEDFGHAGRRFHHPGENLEGRGFPGAVWADQPENLSPRNRKRNAANSLERPVSLRQIGDSDRDILGRRITGGSSRGARPARRSPVALGPCVHR